MIGYHNNYKNKIKIKYGNNNNFKQRGSSEYQY